MAEVVIIGVDPHKLSRPIEVVGAREVVLGSLVEEILLIFIDSRHVAGRWTGRFRPAPGAGLQAWMTARGAGVE